jgi:activator of HSP90 ATPase
MGSRKQSAFTGAPAKVSRKVGGKFSCSGGYIGGVNVEIAENKAIVQAWRAKSWAKGTWTLAALDLASAKSGKT